MTNDLGAEPFVIKGRPGFAAETRLSLGVPRPNKVRPSGSDDALFFLTAARTPSLRARVWYLKAKLERALEFDGHGEVSRGPRLHTTNLAACVELYAVVWQVRHSDCHFYRGTRRNQRSARK